MGTIVAAGSGDRKGVQLGHDLGRNLHTISGHTGSVNDVDFHPFQPISKF